MPIVGGFECLELCLYGIRELASAIPETSPRDREEKTSAGAAQGITVCSAGAKLEVTNLVIIALRGDCLDWKYLIPQILRWSPLLCLIRR